MVHWFHATLCADIYFFFRSTTSEATENTTLEDDQVSVNTVIEKREMTESIFMSSGHFQVIKFLTDLLTM